MYSHFANGFRRHGASLKVFLVLFVLVFVNLFLIVKRGVLRGELNILDGCKHVFIDVGSNRGVQIRKLYQPGLFPEAPIIKEFHSLFGPDLSSVCTVGFEPNPAHERELTLLGDHYANDCGYRVTVFTRTGVGVTEGTAAFHSQGSEFMLDGRIRMAGLETNSSSLVRVIRLSSFLLHTVGPRLLPRPPHGEAATPPRVLVKLDIEGLELEVVTDLIVSGAMSLVDKVLVEWHRGEESGSGPEEGWAGREEQEERGRFMEGARKAAETLAYLSGKLGLKNRFNVTSFDDESYYDQELSLSEC